MESHKIKILFNKDQAYLTDEKFLSLKQLGFPIFTKDFVDNTYWIVRVLKRNEEQTKIFCDIIDYKIDDANFEQNQLGLSDELYALKDNRKSNWKVF
jgi:hypothetical protein